MGVPNYEDFKKVVERKFKRGGTAEEVIEKYKIGSKALDGKPARSTIYNWFKPFQSKSKDEPAAKPVQVDNPVDNPTPEGTPPPQNNAANGAEKLKLEADLPPAADLKMPTNLETIGASAPIGSVQPELKFLKIMVNIPSKGMSDMYEDQMNKRGVNLNLIPLLNWKEWKDLQVSSAEDCLRKYGAGFVFPEWVQKLSPFFPLIDLGASYVVPSVAAGLYARANKNSMDPNAPPAADKPAGSAAAGPTGPVTPQNVVTNSDGSYTMTTPDGKKFNVRPE